MEDAKRFKICLDSKRADFDYSQIQRNRNNPITAKGLPLYPLKISAKEGSSYTYKVSDDWFFKRKLQDGNHIARDDILSDHHYVKIYDELAGSFDDLAEVICYKLSQNIISPKTGKPIVPVAEYKLASYNDENDHLLRGCCSKNICKNPSDKLISMSDIMKFAGQTGKSLDVYMSALKKYCEIKCLAFDEEAIRRELIKQSHFCWKVSNSDNHKNNIMFLISKDENGKSALFASELIDNGSAYELTLPYKSENAFLDRYREIEYAQYYQKVEDIQAKGFIKYDFPLYSRSHAAFSLETDNLLFDDLKYKSTSRKPDESVYFGYELALASEMLSDKELYDDIFEVERQLNLDRVIYEIDEEYGDSKKDGQKSINWPPHLQDYMRLINGVKSQIIAYVVADYYLYAAYTQCIAPVDRNNPQEGYEEFWHKMKQLPLLESKEAYDEAFMLIAQEFGLAIDREQLANIKFKRDPEFTKGEQQPGDGKR